MRSEHFPKSSRLRKRSEYLAVQQRGRKYHGEHFLLLVTPGQITTRIGVTISGKVGNAVVRNRLKRWVREWLRRHQREWPTCAEMVFIGKSTAADASHEAIDADVALLMRRVRGLRS